ncbi:MAG TPA: mucin desulfatase [Clostridiales bacterium]|nr:mucin desulfatase [Clostridiales bacterium]
MADSVQLALISQIFEQYDLSGDIIGCTHLTNGHINETYHIRLADRQQSRSFVLQKINSYVFQEPAKVMNNIQAITRYLNKRKNSRDCGIISFLSSCDGQNYVVQGNDFWRLCPYIENSTAYETAADPAILENAGYAFGHFQEMLADMPMGELVDTIPGFHDTPARLDALFRAVAADLQGRAASVYPEIDFFTRHRQMAGTLAELQQQGVLPLRVTHNDTKCNNILMDSQTASPLCVIDLDTVMPGLPMHDFGDAVRFAANRGAEDETDPRKVGLDWNKYEAFTRGYMRAAKNFLTPAEIDNMALGAAVITIELASRFLADHLNGDKYFRIHREGHNLDRARSQIWLADDMIGQLDQMQAVVRRYAGI